MLKRATRLISMIWELEPITISFVIFLAGAEVVREFGIIDIRTLSARHFQLILANTLAEYVRGAVSMVILGAFLEGCGSIRGRIAGLVGGAIGGWFGCYYSPGFYAGAPVYLGLIGYNITGKCLFRRSVDLRLLLGLASLITPILLAASLQWKETIPLFCGLVGGVVFELIVRLISKSHRETALDQQIDIAPNNDLQIVHLSDLHEDWHRRGWLKVREILTKQIRPNLIIVTGDLVNTPTRKSITAAALEIRNLGEELHIPIIVLPGNHDFSFSGCFLTVPGAKEFFKAMFPTTVRTNRALIVGYESNTNPWLATARIDDNIIKRAQDRFEDTTFSPAALRVAMLHHHVLPLPYAPDRGFLNQDVFLILRNSSSFLTSMARSDVDLILHGHRHKASFLRFTNRINFSERTLSVLSTGSSTLSGQEGGASFNLIKVRPNYSVSVERYFYPPGIEELKVDGPYDLFSYAEQKSRYFRRYEKAQGLTIDIEKRELYIDRFGSVEYTRHIKGLKQNANRRKMFVMRHSTERGTLRPPIARWDMRDGSYQFLNVAEVDVNAGAYAIDLPDAVIAEAGADIQINYRVDFGFSRTKQEAVRLGSREPEKQSVTSDVRYPLKQLIITLRRAEAFSAASVRLRISYYSSIITSAIDKDGDVAVASSDSRVRDEIAEGQERDSLINIDNETWELRINYPLVGYSYTLEWDTTTETFDLEIDDISRITAAQCKNLLARVAGDSTQFQSKMLSILEEFKKEFSVSDADDLFMELYVPDPNANFRLKCMVAQHFGPTGYPSGWIPGEIKPGQGLAGAVFKLGEGTRFVKGAPGESYFVRLPNTPEYEVCIAIPIFDAEAKAADKRGRDSIFEEVGPIMIFFMGSTDSASYLRYFGLKLEEVPSGKTPEETAKKRSVTDWILKQVDLICEL